MQSGEYLTISSVTDFTMTAFVFIKSSRDIPGLRAKPAVMTTNCESLVAS